MSGKGLYKGTYKSKIRRWRWRGRKPFFYILPILVIIYIFSRRKLLSKKCSVAKYGWVKTSGCYSLSYPMHKRRPQRGSCNRIAPSKESGFCLCDDTVITAPVACVHTAVWCEKLCSQSNIIKGSPRSLCQKQKKTMKERQSNPFLLKNRVHPFYSLLIQNLGTSIRQKLPGNRKKEIDYLIFDKKVESKSVHFIRAHMERFLQKNIALSYNITYFPQNKGVVIVGGADKKYRTSYWVCIHSIRRTGSRLPIELWFPEKEMPSTNELRVLEEELLVSVRSFSEIWGGSFYSNGLPKNYQLKIYAIVFSSFNEVLYLDADNVAINLLDSIFSEASYVKHGSLFWQDYWYSSADPSCKDIFGTSSIVKETHESGQMLINKFKIWPALVLAIYMTYNSEIFYPLTCGFLGYGDKEILPFALRKLKISYGLVKFGPDHVGVFGQNGESITDDVFGNTMLQFDNSGQPLFLHANLGKWSTFVPTNVINYVRRWQASVLYGKNITNILKEIAGVDLEIWIYKLISENACLFDDRDPNYWFEKIGVGPLVEGIALHLYPQKNLDLEIFSRYRPDVKDIT